MGITAEEILAEIGPVQEVLDAHDGIVNVIEILLKVTSCLSLDGGCNGCSSTPMTAMQIFYSLMKLDAVNDVIFVNGELPEYMRDLSRKKWQKKAAEADENLTSGGDHEPRRDNLDYSSSFLPIECGLAPNDTLVPLMFILADTAMIRQTSDSGLGR